MECPEQLELKLSKLQNDIGLLEKRRNLLDAEHKTASVNNKSELKKNSLEIKQLRMQVEELQVRVKKQQLDDLKLIQDALQQNRQEMENVKGHSAKEIIRKVESRVLDLNNKCLSLSHRLQILERNKNESENLLQEMIQGCRDENIPTDADCLQHIRDLENEHQKVLKNIEEYENGRNKMKTMLEHLKRRQDSNFSLFMDLKEENMKINRHEQILEDRVEREDSNLGEEEKKIEKFKREISVLKEVTGCHDINDIDSRFLEQKSIHEDLLELKKKAEKHLQELKEDQRDLTSKSDTEPSLAKSRLKEQETRRDSAKAELERLRNSSNRAKETFKRLISRMQPKANEDQMQNESVGQLAKQLENIVMKKFPRTKHIWASNICKKGSQ